MIKQIYVDMTESKGITLKQNVKVACASCVSCKEIVLVDDSYMMCKCAVYDLFIPIAVECKDYEKETRDKISQSQEVNRMNKQEIFLQDDITIKVKQCNELLSSLGLKVGALHYVSSADTKRGYVPLSNGKVVTKNTYDKLHKEENK